MEPDSRTDAAPAQNPHPETVGADDARRTAERLRGLMEANLAIVGDLDLPTVLQRIVDTARDLVGAQYAALGVVGPADGGLEEFITAGMTATEVNRIGRPPAGRGLLGALIADPCAIRLDHLGDDRRAAGLPPAHPPMESFLGVPIQVRGVVFGNLYLTNARSGHFDDDDQALLSCLAAAAGVAIANARLFAEGLRRQQWLRASADFSRQVLTVAHDLALRLLVEHVQRLAEADLVALVVPHDDNAEHTVAAAVGETSPEVIHVSFPSRGTATEQVLTTGAPLLIATAAEWDVDGHRVPRMLAVGPAMLLPLADHSGVRGVLIACRRVGRRSFDEVDLDMGAAFATHASLAMELAEARIDQQRMALFEEQARIAHDLHDHVLQQLFAAGMLAQGVATGLADDSQTKLLDKVVDTLDDAIKEIRTSIFRLQPHQHTGSSLRSLVLTMVAEVVPTLGFAPHLYFEGPVDAVSDDALASDVLAVVLEALSNVAKHVDEGTATVRVTASDTTLQVVVEDTGTGIGSASRRAGLGDLRQRAERRHGALEVADVAGGHGTRLTWSVPLG